MPLSPPRPVAKALHAAYEHDLDDAGRAVCDETRSEDDHLMVFSVQEWIGQPDTGSFGVLVRDAAALGCLFVIVGRYSDLTGGVLGRVSR